MFRVFLVNRLVSADSLPREDENRQNILPPKKSRNRRVYERFDLDSSHLTLMNDQDILVVRDLSENGFSTEVSPLGFKRLLVGDLYLCRLRYLSEIYSMKARVAWKAGGFVGFEIYEADTKIKTFLARLVRPMDIALGFKEMPESQNKDRRKWFHSAAGPDLYLWQDDDNDVQAWRFQSDNEYMSWDRSGGLQSGEVVPAKSVAGAENVWEGTTVPHSDISSELERLVTDVFMALKIPEKSDLIKTLAES